MYRYMYISLKSTPLLFQICLLPIFVENLIKNQSIFLQKKDIWRKYNDRVDYRHNLKFV